MNPFTRFLSQWLEDRQLKEFVTYWDSLEVMMVGVYRQKVSTGIAESEFVRIWSWLRQHYDKWEPLLRPYWQRTEVGGQRIQCDPFRLLITIKHPTDILDNWVAMQHLPAAREALNQFVLAAHERE